MSISLRVPTEPPSWCRSPQGYRKHQALLQQLVDFFIKNGVEVELPEETGGHDNGVDLLVGPEKTVIDLKSFWLTLGPKTRSWKSPFHSATSGRKSTWAGKETEVYIHADFTVPVEQWLVGRAADLNMSFNGGPPFYYRNRVKTLKAWFAGRSLSL